MQRIGTDFIIKRSWNVLKAGGIMLELYEMPNDTLQFGKNRDAKVVTSLEEVTDFPGEVQALVSAQIERQKTRPIQSAVVEGAAQSGAIHVGNRLAQAVAALDPIMQAKLLASIESIVGPVTDSLLQGQGPEAFVPGLGTTSMQPFLLPAGGKYVDPTRPDAGYLTLTGRSDEKGRPEMAWHPTPQYLRMEDGQVEPVTTFDADRLQPDPIPLMEAASDVTAELNQARDLVGAGASKGRATRSRR